MSEAGGGWGRLGEAGEGWGKLGKAGGGWGRLGEAGGGWGRLGEAIAPNILGVSLRFKQNYRFRLLNSDSPLI